MDNQNDFIIVQQSVPTAGGRISAVRVVLCAVLSLLLLADVTVLSAVVGVKSVFTRENVRQLVRDSDYMTLPLNFDGVDTNLYEMLFFAFANKSSDTVDVYTLAEQVGLADTLADTLFGYGEFILYKKGFEQLDSKTLKKFIGENYETISGAFGSEMEISDAYAAIDEQEAAFDSLTAMNVEKSVPAVGLIRFLFTFAGIGVLIFFALLCSVLIGVVTKSVGTPLVLLGASVLLNGLAGAVTVLMAVTGAIPMGGDSAAQLLLRGAVTAIFPQLFNASVWVSVGGMISVLTGAFLGMLRRNRRKVQG